MTHPTSTIRVPARRKQTVLQMSGAVLTVGTSILTARGTLPADDLKPGDMIVTKDLGLQKLRYIAFQDVDLVTSPEMAPVKANSRHFGLGEDSYFAPDARISVRHPMFDMMFGSSEVLIRCGDLVDHPGFEPAANLRSVTYIALGFSGRHIVSCNGALVDIGPANQKASRTSLSCDETKLAMQLLEPRQVQPKRHSFPLH